MTVTLDGSVAGTGTVNVTGYVAVQGGTCGRGGSVPVSWNGDVLGGLHVGHSGSPGLGLGTNHDVASDWGSRVSVVLVVGPFLLLLLSHVTTFPPVSVPWVAGARHRGD